MGAATTEAAPQRAERETGEGIDGRLRGRLVAAVFRAALVEVAVPVQPHEGAIVDTSHDVGDAGLRGRRRLVRAHGLAVLLEEGVDGQQEAASRAARARMAVVFAFSVKE